jgi:hypothetical protein
MLCRSDDVALGTVGCNKLSTLKALAPVHRSIFADIMLVVALSTEIWTLHRARTRSSAYTEFAVAGEANSNFHL